MQYKIYVCLPSSTANMSVQVVVEALLQDKALRESLKVSTPSRVSFELRMWSRIKAVGMLYILLFITLPISLFGMANFIFWHILFHKDFQSPRIPPGWRGTALVSGELSVVLVECQDQACIK